MHEVQDPFPPTCKKVSDPPMLRDFLRILPLYLNTMSMEEKVDAYNKIVTLVADIVGIDHPVLRPKLVKVDTLAPGSDTPAFILESESRILELSIKKSGMTLPVVVCGSSILDGADRLNVCRQSRDLRASFAGYVPVVEVTPMSMMKSPDLYTMAHNTLF